MPGLARACAMKASMLVDRERRVHHQHADAAHGAGDRHDVAQEIELQIVVERGAGGVGHADGEQRVAVGRGAHDRLGADVAARAGTVLDHERLAELLRERLRDDPHKDVDRAAGRKADDDAHRPVRPGLRRRVADAREQGSARERKDRAARERHASSSSAEAAAWRPGSSGARSGAPCRPRGSSPRRTWLCPPRSGSHRTASAGC